MTQSTVTSSTSARPSILGEQPMKMKEAARACGVHVATLWRWVQSGARGQKLNSTLLGGQRYVTKADLDAFLAAINGRRAA